MFDEKEHATALGGLVVKDAHIALQLLDKAASNGVIQPVEFKILGEWRTSFTDAIQRSVGKDYDVEVAKLQQARLEAQQAETAEQPEDTAEVASDE
jgi:hypothetical protein